MRRSLPLMNQRRRWYAFWVIMACIAMTVAAKAMPDWIAGPVVIGSFVVTMAAATILAFGPKPTNPWE